MPNITNHEFLNASYSLAKHKPAADTSGKLPESHGESVKPDFLLHHENHFDKNTYTPEQTPAFKPEPIKTA